MATQVTKTEASLEELAEAVRSRGSGRFQSKETRDAVSYLLGSWGYSHTRSRISNQRLHPEYVTDFVGTYYTGFGNSVYQTHWAKLYCIEDVR
jgi:hypothetical protein